MPASGSPKHSIRWYAYADGQRIPRTSQMRGQWGYDAVCSCGWDSRTGGGVRSYVAEQVADHKAYAAMCDDAGGHLYRDGRCIICGGTES